MATKSNADIVNGWFSERLSSGPIAQHTGGYNQLVEALPALIAALDAAAPPAPDANLVREPPKTKTAAKTAASDPAAAQTVDPAAGQTA